MRRKSHERISASPAHEIDDLGGDEWDDIDDHVVEAEQGPLPPPGTPEETDIRSARQSPSSAPWEGDAERARTRSRAVSSADSVALVLHALDVLPNTARRITGEGSRGGSDAGSTAGSRVASRLASPAHAPTAAPAADPMPEFSLDDPPERQEMSAEVEDMSTPQPESKRCSPKVVLIAVLVVLLFVFLWVTKGAMLEWLSNFVEEWGMWGTVGVTAVLVLWSFLLLPLLAYETLVGFLFPFHIAMVVCVVGKLIGGCTCYVLLSRSKLGRVTAERFLEKHQHLAALQREMHLNQFRMTLLVRLAAVPVALKTAFCIVMRVDPRIFFICTAIESPIYAAPIVLAGGRLKSVSEILSGERQFGMGELFLLVLGLGSLILFFGVAGYMTRRALKPNSPPNLLTSIKSDDPLVAVEADPPESPDRLPTRSSRADSLDQTPAAAHAA